MKKEPNELDEWCQAYEEREKSRERDQRWQNDKIKAGIQFHKNMEAQLRKGEFKNFVGFGHKEKGLFWFRFKHNNKGFHIKNTKLHPLLFGERMNIKGSGFSIGNWHFKWLKKYEG